MRWLSGVRGVWVVVLSVVVVACGSSGGDDELTLAFQGFDGEEIEQADQVGATSADVDVCQSICFTGEEVEGEFFTQTLVNARFVNRGKVDIVLDEYTVSVPGSGVADQVRSISARIPGGRCADGQTQCAFDSDCLGAICFHQETSIALLLFDFNFKSLVVDGQCPSFENPAGSVISRTRDVFLTFRGKDEADKSRTVEAQYATTFTDFDNCDQ
jgi:hypothetical protein